jgi:hypothetical protein
VRWRWPFRSAPSCWFVDLVKRGLLDVGDIDLVERMHATRCGRSNRPALRRCCWRRWPNNRNPSLATPSR